MSARSLEELLEEVQDLGIARGATLHNILHRNAGWGLHWYESERDEWRTDDRPSDNFESALVVYTYKPTLREAVEAEIQRLKGAA